MFHEHATNSAKYGSLSVPSGIVLLNSRVSGAVLEIDWQESDGPPVDAPQKQGFGMRHLSRALAQFGGSTDILFEKSGVVCKMTLHLPVGTVFDPVGSDAKPVSAGTPV